MRSEQFLPPQPDYDMSTTKVHEHQHGKRPSAHKTPITLQYGPHHVQLLLGELHLCDPFRPSQPDHSTQDKCTQTACGKTKHAQDAKNCTICASAASCSGTASAMIAVMSTHRACWVVKHYTTTQKKNAPSQSAPPLRLRTQMQWIATCAPLRLDLERHGWAKKKQDSQMIRKGLRKCSISMRTCTSHYGTHLQKIFAM